jgi:MFS family permease
VFSLLFQQQDGYIALRAGLAFLPLTVAVMAASVFTGKVCARIGRRPEVVAGLALMAAGGAGLLWAGPGTPFPEMVGQLVLLGAGVGLIVPPMTSSVMGSVDKSRSGIASGTLTALRQTGGVLGVAVFGSLIAAKGQFAHGLHAALVISISAIGLAAALTPAIRSPGLPARTLLVAGVSDHRRNRRDQHRGCGHDDRRGGRVVPDHGPGQDEQSQAQSHEDEIASLASNIRSASAHLLSYSRLTALGPGKPAARLLRHQISAGPRPGRRRPGSEAAPQQRQPAPVQGRGFPDQTLAE